MTFTTERSTKEIKQAYQEGFRHGFSEGMRTQLSEIWIPTERRLPRYEDPVLVTYRNRVEIAWYGKDGQWHDGECGLEKNEVTAWLGLPDPYGCED